MKQLFITHTKKNKKKEQRKDIFLCCERKENKIDYNEKSPSLNIPESHLSSRINTIKSSAISVANTSADSRKISFQIIPPDQASISTNFSVSSNNIINCPNNINNDNFLGKKSKIHFDVIKNDDTKTINLNNLNTFSNSSSQSITDSLYSKDLEKSESIELIEERNNTYDNINDSTNNLKTETNNERNNNVNAGRWSYEEHIKFIEAIAEHGKNWKEVQKYVGSRTSAQARSHAQKFFLKLIATKNNEFDFDFRNKNIKSLSHIIELLKRKKEYLIQGKQYIINTLISLSETISNDLCKKSIKNSKNETIEIPTIKKNKQLKFDIINDPISNEIKLDSEKTNISEKKEKRNPEKKKNINENKNNEKIIYKNIEEQNLEKIDKLNKDKDKEDKINPDNKNINNIKRDNLVKETKPLEENNNEEINDINDNKNDEEIENKDIQNKEIKNNYNDIFFEEEEKNKKYLFDDGKAFIFDDSNFEFFMTNNLSIIIKEAFFIKNYKSSNAFFNSYFS